MKTKKLNLLVTFLVVLSLVLGSTVTASAAAVKINKKSLSVYSGKTATIKMLNTSKKVTWTSSKKSVATVKATGKATAKITAKKAGTAIITAKVGTKKYKCKVTVKNPVGSTKNPANAKKGVKVKTEFGTMYFKLTDVYRGDEAVSLFKEYDAKTWDHYEENKDNFISDYYNYELIGLEYEVEAKSGFDECPLLGSDIISVYRIHDAACQNALDVFPMALEENKELDVYSLSLNAGESSKMYAFYLVPLETKEFCACIYINSVKDYWVKYSI